MLSALFLAAGVGIVGAFPHPQRWGQPWGHAGHEHRFSGLPKYTFSGPDMPTSFPSLPSASAASGILPSGYVGTTGFATGTAGASCAVQYVTVSATGASSLASSVPVVSSASYNSSMAAASSVSSAAPYSAATSSSAAAPSSVYAAADSSSAVSATPIPSAGTATISADSGCTFTDADAAEASKGSCSNIVLDGITVPAGETLDLSDLNDGTSVSHFIIKRQRLTQSNS